MDILVFGVNLMGRKVKEAVDGVNASSAQGRNWTNGDSSGTKLDLLKVQGRI